MALPRLPIVGTAEAAPTAASTTTLLGFEKEEGAVGAAALAGLVVIPPWPLRWGTVRMASSPPKTTEAAVA